MSQTVHDDPSGVLSGIPGRLMVSASAFTSFTSTADPWGGTVLGGVVDTIVTRTVGSFEIPAEEYGMEIVEEIRNGETWAVSFALRKWDDDCLKWSGLPTAVGAQTGRRYVDPSAAPRPGYRMSDALGNLRLVFVPDDVKNHPALVVYRAIPKVAKTMEVQLRNRIEARLVVGFVAARTAADPPVRWGMLADLTAPA